MSSLIYPGNCPGNLLSAVTLDIAFSSFKIFFKLIDLSKFITPDKKILAQLANPMIVVQSFGSSLTWRCKAELDLPSYFTSPSQATIKLQNLTTIAQHESIRRHRVDYKDPCCSWQGYTGVDNFVEKEKDASNPSSIITTEVSHQKICPGRLKFFIWRYSYCRPAHLT